MTPHAWVAVRVWPTRVETDAGLPVFRRDFQPGWTRQALPTAWGRYRRTVARIRAGQGMARANFGAELPEAGRWLLSYHVPDLKKVGMYSEIRSTNDEQGIHGIEISSGGTVTTVDFDAAAATPGWNEIDAFDLGAGAVRVTVSDKTSGNAVVADAIRWERSPSALDRGRQPSRVSRVWAKARATYNLPRQGWRAPSRHERHSRLSSRTRRRGYENRSARVRRANGGNR